MAETDRISGLIGTLGIKAPVRAATTANVTLSGEQTIDGVALVLGDRVLAKDQTAASENGIYYVELGAWTRAPDFDGPRDVAKGTMVCASEGTANANVIYRVTTTGEIVFGSTAITFAASAFGGDIAARIHDAANKVTPVGADEFGIWDSVSGALNRLSATNLVAYLSGLCSAGWNAATATLAAACSGNAATATTATNQSGGTVDATSVVSAGNVLAGKSALIGYSDCNSATGWDVTQLTNKATAVTLNKPYGKITTHNAALAAGAIVTFTLNNSLINVRDLIIVNGYDTVGSNVDHYSFTAIAGAGFANIGIKNMTGGSLSEVIIINFAILRCGTITV